MKSQTFGRDVTSEGHIMGFEDWRIWDSFVDPYELSFQALDTYRESAAQALTQELQLELGIATVTGLDPRTRTVYALFKHNALEVVRLYRTYNEDLFMREITEIREIA